MGVRNSLNDIAADYPRLELLESGHIKEWLESRSAHLFDKAVSASWTKDGIKTTGFCTCIAGAIWAASPLGIPVVTLSLVGYIAIMMEDREETRTVYPLPWGRLSFEDTIKLIFGDKERKQREFKSNYIIVDTPEGQIPVRIPEWRKEKERLFRYLPIEERSEAIFLMNNFSVRKNMENTIDRILHNCPSHNRFLLYRLILREYQHHGDLALTPQQVGYLYQELNDYYGYNVELINHLSQGRRSLSQQQTFISPTVEPAASYPVAPRSQPIAETQIPTWSPPTSRLATPAPVLQPEEPADFEIPDLSSLAIQVQSSDDNGDLAIVKAECQRRQNLLVLSAGGGGKGIFLSNLFRFRAEKDKNLFAFWVDPKNSPDEAGYFDHPNIVGYRFNGLACSQEERVEHIRNAIQKFKDILGKLPPKTPALLCFDEWTATMKMLEKTETLDEVKSYITLAVSMLDGFNTHIIIVGQSPNLPDILPGGGGILANFSTMALFRKEDRSFKMFEKCQQTGAIPKNITTDQLYSFCDRSPVGRAVYINGGLRSMPRLENYSSYDRDSGKTLSASSLKHYKNIAQRQEAPVAQPTQEEQTIKEAPVVQPTQEEQIIKAVKSFGKHGVVARTIAKQTGITDAVEILESLVDEGVLRIETGDRGVRYSIGS